MTDNLDILLLEFYTKLAESQEDVDPEFAQILEDNFWELIGVGSENSNDK